MPVKFETFYDRLRVVIPTLTGFTAKAELSNPYEVEDNLEGAMRDGWGVAIGETSEGQAEYNSSVDIQTFGVVLTREVVKTENNPQPMVDTVKAMKADVLTLKRGLMDLMAIESTIENLNYIGTSGIDTVEADRHRIISITVAFSANIRETL